MHKEPTNKTGASQSEVGLKRSDPYPFYSIFF